MQLITVILQPTRSEAVRTALHDKGFVGLTLTEVQGYGVQAGHTEYYRGTAHEVEFRPKIRLEILVSDDREELAVETIVEHARSGNIGDGKVWVTPVSRVVRIRTGESGDLAI